MNRYDFWAKSCLRKKRLSENIAEQIILKSETPLRKYYCNICCGFHLTKQK